MYDLFNGRGCGRTCCLRQKRGWDKKIGGKMYGTKREGQDVGDEKRETKCMGRKEKGQNLWDEKNETN